MAGAGLINMSPYQWTPAAQLAVQANGQAVEAAKSMDKNRPTQKKKGLGSGLGSAIGGIAGSYFGPMGSMVGSTLGGMIGGAIGGDSESAMAGAGEGLGMGMAMASTGTSDKIQSGMKDFFKNSGLDTAGDAAKSGGFNFDFAGSTESGKANNDLMGKITANNIGMGAPNGAQFNLMNPSSMALPFMSGAR